MEGPTSKKTNEPPKRVNLKGNIKFPNPLPLQECLEMVGNQRHAIRGYNQTFEGLSGIIKFLKVHRMAPWPCG